MCQGEGDISGNHSLQEFGRVRCRNEFAAVNGKVCHISGKGRDVACDFFGKTVAVETMRERDGQFRSAAESLLKDREACRPEKRVGKRFLVHARNV